MATCVTCSSCSHARNRSKAGTVVSNRRVSPCGSSLAAPVRTQQSRKRLPTSIPAQRSMILPIVTLLAVEEPARNHKLFHGLEGTNQGIHQRQPGTVLSTGFSRHSGEVLSFDDQLGSSPPHQSSSPSLLG